MIAPSGGTELRPSKVLFACVHNAGRSQIASAFFNAVVDPARAFSVSAGTEPAERVHPQVVEAMREVGIDRLVTMGCGENACPVIPAVRREDWPLSDPSGKSLADVRVIRDDIRARVAELVRQHGWKREGA